MQILHSHSRRKHYAAPVPDSQAFLGYLYPTLCGQNGMTTDEFARRFNGDPADHPMCKRCERKAGKTS